MKYDTVKQPQPHKMIMSQKWIHCLTRFGPFSSIHCCYPRSVTLTGQREANQNAGKNIMALDRHVLMTILVKL